MMAQKSFHWGRGFKLSGGLFYWDSLHEKQPFGTKVPESEPTVKNSSNYFQDFELPFSEKFEITVRFLTQ